MSTLSTTVIVNSINPNEGDRSNKYILECLLESFFSSLQGRPSADVFHCTAIGLAHVLASRRFLR